MIRLKTLLKQVRFSSAYTGEDLIFSRLDYDSRKVAPGSLFVAIKGFHSDGHEYVRDAVARGAVACVVEHPVDCACPQVVVENTRIALAELSYRFYRTAEAPFALTGITGTNGKTTIAHLLYQLAEAEGLTPALIGTLGVKTPYQKQEGERTTPESIELAGLFDGFARQNVNAVFMEVSSHAIALHRVRTLLFNAAVFTNLTQDHLDFHRNMEDYFLTKSHLFDQLKPGGAGIVNTDDPYGKRLYASLKTPRVSYAVNDVSADVHFRSLSLSVHGIHGELRTRKGTVQVAAPLLGAFNAENIAGGIACWQSLFPDSTLDLDYFPFKPIAGRMEMVPTRRGTAVIDYAHTPDAMEKALKTASALEGRKRLITLFGCGGDRDHGKRPLMGAVAEKYADTIILTNDNPRNEQPQLIAKAIMKGMRSAGRVSVCLDRREAIVRAYQNSEPGDLLMILGKGAETYMEIKGERIPFNDKEIIEQLETSS
ncbi:MAG: UDP-N-acetylmuramoyl-L-alanyl-D-glutamate--2,6-diaminopimelate ligase [Candidatus Marinimicrobia bacterium]|nr:UDP-N-acetylmuramoyl-L-alanyl-D-glutamate--2,6-diaminopimelate ligase [Candidatus Neomarinimicrobiota bacterium]